MKKAIVMMLVLLCSTVFGKQAVGQETPAVQILQGRVDAHGIQLNKMAAAEQARQARAAKRAKIPASVRLQHNKDGSVDAVLGYQPPPDCEEYADDGVTCAHRSKSKMRYYNARKAIQAVDNKVDSLAGRVDVNEEDIQTVNDKAEEALEGVRQADQHAADKNMHLGSTYGEKPGDVLPTAPFTDCLKWENGPIVNGNWTKVCVEQKTTDQGLATLNDIEKSAGIQEKKNEKVKTALIAGGTVVFVIVVGVVTYLIVDACRDHTPPPSELEVQVRAPVAAR